MKRVVNKEDLESSESEDLIFVKEIREENIVHEIESETGNNTSFTEKDYDDVKNVENTDARKRRTLESDKIVKCKLSNRTMFSIQASKSDFRV